MRMGLFMAGVLLVAALASAAAGKMRVVWVTTIHRGANITIGRTYRERARALADARRSGGDPTVWIVIEPSEYVKGGAK
jgi:hypothetical protein